MDVFDILWLQSRLMKKIIHLLPFVILLFCSEIIVAQKSIDTLLLSLQNIMEEEDIPGIMMSVVRSDTVLFSGGLGYADISAKEMVTADHLFRLGSISKSITALGLVKLSLNNKLSLSSTIQEIDENLEIENPWSEIAPITVEQILEHTAGFDAIHGNASIDEPLEKTSCLEKVKTHNKSLYARWKPGTRMAYSNPGYIVAGHLIETITETSYDKYLKDNILTPIGMEKSGFYFTTPLAHKMATGYIREGGELSTLAFKSVSGGPASDFCSTANEMALFLMYMLSGELTNDNKAPIPFEVFERIENSKTTLASKNGFVGGYGLGNNSIWGNNFLFHGHDGGIDGFSSIYLYSREADLGFVVSMNVQRNLWKITDEIFEHYLGKNIYLDSSTVTIPKVTKEKFEGFYTLKSPRNQTMYFIQKMMNGHSLEFVNEKLIIKDFAGVVRDTLYHKGQNVFYRKSEGIPFLMLLNGENKKPAIWLGTEYGEKGNKPIRQLKNYTLIASLILALQFLFVGLIVLVRQLWRKKKLSSQWKILWFTSLFLILTFLSFLFSLEFYDVPDRVSIGSLLVFITSIAFFIFSILSVFNGFRIHEMSLMNKWYYRITAVSLFGIALWLFSNGLIGFMMWNY